MHPWALYSPQEVTYCLIKHLGLQLTIEIKSELRDADTTNSCTSHCSLYKQSLGQCSKCAKYIHVHEKPL